MTTLRDRIEQVAAARPDRLAVLTSHDRLTYAELARRVDARAAAHRASAGARPRAAVLAGDAVEVAVEVAAAELAGVSLLLLDAAGPDAEHASVRAAFLAVDESSATSGLGLTTSGVGGRRKCVERPWATVISNAASFSHALDLDEDDVTLCTTPPHHSYAVCGGIVSALLAGASYLGMGPRIGPSGLARTVDELPVSVVLSVPLLYRWWAAGVPTSRRPRLCVSAGSALPATDRASWQAGVGWPLREHYGTSELGMLTLDRVGLPGSVGAAIDGVELAVRPGEEPEAGEVLARVAGPSPRLINAFAAAGTAAVRELSGWQPTGDLGRVDGTGALWLSGRRGTALNVAGNKVSATEVEEAIRGYGPILDCAVVGLATGGGPVRVCAFVEATDEFDRRALIAHLTAQLALYKVPTVVKRVERLPRSSSGKILRGALSPSSQY
ncbi:class I adenylate-forming enzyme family protein [Micromonospora inyonensis]|uniref:Acyl-CoA synthetase (AMP-forming)/AMP-acid ligase II n=1 Tax=Micromonospora inyonensis TaxID=47866 RepID=A0A1C6RLQ9_9ACTN|nr:fatty acid--CoA ligase family protein [Micromonospora inyonensis]SCL18003.1 Acyl-CoA synthetase (AMP-forming)/AMP-acid ligase II [Micromonospora inyonensis]